MKHCIMLIALFIVSLGAAEAQNIFMKIENGGPGLDGEVTRKGYEKWIKLNAIEIGAENNINIGSISAGGGAGKATFKDIHINKSADNTSAIIAQNLAEGKHFNKVTIHKARKMPDGTFKPEVEINFEFVMVQDYELSISDATPDESIVLQCGKMQIKYHTYDAGGKQQPPRIFGWDRIENLAWK